MNLAVGREAENRVGVLGGREVELLGGGGVPLGEEGGGKDLRVLGVRERGGMDDCVIVGGEEMGQTVLRYDLAHLLLVEVLRALVEPGCDGGETNLRLYNVLCVGHDDRAEEAVDPHVETRKESVRSLHGEEGKRDALRKSCLSAPFRS